MLAVGVTHAASDGGSGERQRGDGGAGKRRAALRREGLVIWSGLGGGSGERRVGRVATLAALADDDYMPWRSRFWLLGHLFAPLVSFMFGAATLQAVFGFCRSHFGGVVSQSTLMSIVPRHFMGRTQSAMAIVTTAVQLTMCVALGWIAEKAGL